MSKRFKKEILETLLERRPELRHLAEFHALDAVLGPLLEKTRDAYHRVFVEQPLTEMMETLAALDVNALKQEWERVQDTWREPERDTLVSLLTHRLISFLGAVNEVDRIPFNSSTYFQMLRLAFMALDEAEMLEAYKPVDPDPLPAVEPRPLLLFWRPHEIYPNVLECVLNGTVVDIEAMDPSFEDEAKKEYWLLLEYQERFGFRLKLEKEVYLDPDQNSKKRFVVEETEILEQNIPGQENRFDAPIERQAGKEAAEETYYEQALELYLMASELATDYVNFGLLLRWGVYTNAPYLSDWIKHPERFGVDGKGPYPYPQIEYVTGEETKADWLRSGKHQHKTVYAGRNFETVTGGLSYGQLVRFDENGGGYIPAGEEYEEDGQ